MSQIRSLRLYPLRIPLRKPIGHAAHERRAADPVVLQIELADHTVGYGETLPRTYVSGESVDSVLANMQEAFGGFLLDFRPRNFPDALELIDNLPYHNEEGEAITAARAMVEMALLDACSRHFKRRLNEAVGWLGLPGFGPPGCVKRLRYSGVVTHQPVGKLKSSVKKMWWYGLRDFKLKVGFDDDIERIQAVADALGRSLGETTTLRLDANGGWTLERAMEVLDAVEDIPISCVEQPLPSGQEHVVQRLKKAVSVDVMHDESLVTFEDAERLLDLGVADAFNIRLAKNGGFLAGVRLAHFAAKNGVVWQLGCMVGETSILSAAGRKFLENVSQTVFAEGSYGRFILEGDVIERPVQFGLGGKIKPLSGLGWGVDVREGLLKRYSLEGPLEFRF